MINDIQISKNFKLREFECKDGNHQVMIHAELLSKLQTLRDKVGSSIVINSGYRTPEYNNKIGGVNESFHTKGMAVDIQIPKGYTVDSLAVLAKSVGFRGIGKYKTFLHVDVRPTLTQWDYR